MAEFAKYYVDFLWKFLQNLWGFIWGILKGFYKFFIEDIIEYCRDLGSAVGNFDVLGWIMLVVVIAINSVLVFFILYRLFQLIRRYVIFRAKEVEKDKLMEEIAKLQQHAEELVQEKNKIFALKVGVDSGVGGGGGPSRGDDMRAQVGMGGESPTQKAGASRFTKLINLDEKYERNPREIFMTDADYLALPEIVERFINFSASQLRLYYKPVTIRQFFAGLATSKIMILEGISGTGKTSLPYAMSKFFNNNAAIISVQPSWRDRAELIGYFNEFTKKFNETDFLSSLYECTLREDPNFIVLDEMNLARIEYYFADFLSIMEMPDATEWKIDLVPNALPSDPKNIVAAKLLVPQNVWFVGTANNDDSTFTITDKVYDRAVALALNEKAPYFDAPMTESFNCSYEYLESLFDQARKDYALSEANLKKLIELDEFIQSKFKMGFGNRIMKQIKIFVPTYVACGGAELDAIDFMVFTKILRKFIQLNLAFLTKELGELVAYLEKAFGKGAFKLSVDYIRQLEKMA